MKSGHLSVILLIFISESILLSQTNGAGNVTDSLYIPVPFASLYLSNTSVGTFANIKGNYTLSIPQEGTYELIVYSIKYKLSAVFLEQNKVNNTGC